MAKYTEITVTAPDRAAAGEVVPIEVTIENVSTEPEPHNIDEALPVLRINGGVLTGDGQPLAYFGDEKSYTWTFQYTMPNKSVTINAESWCESYYVDWHLDDVASHAILLPGAVDLTEIITYAMVAVMMIMMIQMVEKEL